MPQKSTSHKASLAGAFFVLRCIIGGLLTAPVAAGTALVCPAQHLDEWVRVRHVIDGDTVVLADRRTLRLIGIDTPEMGYYGAPPEPLAQQARDALQHLVGAHGNILGLRYDRERRDAYGRTLAHAYLDDGSNVSATLLTKGLAVQLIIPPNDWQVRCYRERQAFAEQRRRGLWALARYQPVESTTLDPFGPGFRLVRGRVSLVSRGRHSLWIHLEGGFRAWILYKDLHYFDRLQPKNLLGRRVEVRGYVHGTPAHRRMQLRHPAALRVLAKDWKWGQSPILRGSVTGVWLIGRVRHQSRYR